MNHLHVASNNPILHLHSEAHSVHVFLTTCNDDNNNDGVQYITHSDEWKGKSKTSHPRSRALFKKGQTLRPNRVPGGAFDEGCSHFCTAVAVYDATKKWGRGSQLTVIDIVRALRKDTVP